MVTLADIAAKTGVSINTVSLVLRDRPLQIPVRPDTIERIKRTARELDYRPNRAARTLRLKRSNLIGLVVREFRHPLFAQINQSIITGLEERGFGVLVTDEPTFENPKPMEELYNHQVDGMVVGPFYAGPVNSFFKRLIEQKYPLVSFFHDGEVAMDAVTIDKPGAVAAAVRHFVKMGHRRIGCIVSNSQHPMLGGYRRAMQDADLPVRDSWIHPFFGSIENGHRLGQTIEVGTEQPTAYFFHDDAAALGFMRGLHERGVRVPQEVAIVGYGNTPMANYSLVSLSSLRLPIQKVVQAIISFLTRRIEGRPLRGWQQLVLQAELVVRQSSDFARASD